MEVLVVDLVELDELSPGHELSVTPAHGRHREQKIEARKGARLKRQKRRCVCVRNFLRGSADSHDRACFENAIH